MLRASAIAAGHPIDLRAVPAAGIDPGLPAGRELIDFTDALVGDAEPGALITARRALIETIGPDGAARAALVAGNFEMMNRILDATGVPVPARMGDITAELGLLPFAGRH